MTIYVPLDEIDADDTARVGGKAVALAILARAGIAVPPTHCLLTHAYERFVDAADLRPVIGQELGRKRFADMRWEEIWDAALRIRSRFLRAEIPPDLADAITRPLAEAFGNRRLVVRSSAPDEDTDGATFAGLHDSIVGVQGSSATLEAVRNVWASLWSDRALLYRQELGLDVDRSRMAVVIQELVEGTCSGIAFGVHPTDPQRVAVEAVYGLNQGLVDGSIEPDRWSLERHGGDVRDHVAPAARRRLVRSGAGLVVEDVPEELGAVPPLDLAALGGVFAAVNAVGDLFGRPQDVEWTRADKELVLLQSRPITTAPASEGDARAWNLSLTRSLENLRGLRTRVESELLPAMDREAEARGLQNLQRLDADELAAEIDRRRDAYDHWVDVYWRDFIPLAHGIRLFGLFYNETVRPEDPYEFMSLLTATPMLSVQRNESLARLASRVRTDDVLRACLEADEPGDEAFEQELVEFERAFGDAVFADRPCFEDRRRLVRLLLLLAAADALPKVARDADVDDRLRTFWTAAGADRRAMAEEVLELGRTAYRLRDDDNLYLARFEALVLEADDEARRRRGDPYVAPALRHPNRVAEPLAPPRRLLAKSGFRPKPRQLVGQPAGPGVATGPARIVQGVDDLFLVERGDVLVCDAIDPNMTFIVPLASAIVERRGGMLIHGAIIAREYGLPCVTGVPDAIAQIEPGDRLTVDGYLGIVTVTRPHD